jgi:hypothetical protein
MDKSLVYRRIHFLMELGQASKTTRKLLVRYMTIEQMEALSNIAGYIVYSQRPSNRYVLGKSTTKSPA